MFDEVAEALRGLAPRELGDLRTRARRYGIKAWYGPVNPPREHYEAQVIGAAYVEDATVLALELGFHAEHPTQEANDAAIGERLDGGSQVAARVGSDRGRGTVPRSA